MDKLSFRLPLMPLLLKILYFCGCANWGWMSLTGSRCLNSGDRRRTLWSWSWIISAACIMWVVYSGRQTLFCWRGSFCAGILQPPHRDIHKTALGATETVDWRYFGDTAAA